ncbi:unnamed protein product, partial [Mesorhabditis belari]|uniref:Uncharacterized protein n=1 Tax=Mesorhabditis belari TaxID=2138241 RepID=A0AAF3EQN4_9BILA
MWSIQDPKDPWAWRNTWTGEIRNSYDDLWIVIPIIVLVTVFAMLFLIPILIHRYCPHCFPGRVWCRWFESLLFVLGQISREKEEKRIERKRPTRAHPRAHSAPNFHDHVEYGVPHSIPIKTESPPQYQRGEAGHPNVHSYAEADVGYNETATIAFDVQLRWSEQVKNSESEEYEDVARLRGRTELKLFFTCGEKPGLIRAGHQQAKILSWVSMLSSSPNRVYSK